MMRLRVRLLNLWLRFTTKRALNRMKSPDEMRVKMERDAERFFSMPEGAHELSEFIRRPDGSAIESLWLSRKRPDRHRVILYFHGGAYIAGSPRTHRHLAASLAGAAGARSILPGYRLAPEHPFPAALDDAVLVYSHLLDVGYAPQRIAIAGDSAGGGLAFALALKLMDAGVPLPAALVGFSPWTDLTGRAESLTRNALRDAMLPARRLPEVVEYYLGGHPHGDPLASPMLGTWRAPPPALIMASRSEILLDDAVGMAETLRNAGGDVALELWKGLPHAWPIFAGMLSEADAAIENAGRFLERHMSKDDA